MAKDRAAPFSRKHRRYFIPVTGGMLLIGALNVGIGMCAYEPPRTPERINLVIPPPTPVGHPEGTLGLAEIPTPVIRGFAVAYPRHIPTLTKLLPAAGGAAAYYELSFLDAGTTRVVRFASDGTEIAAGAK